MKTKRLLPQRLLNGSDAADWHVRVCRPGPPPLQHQSAVAWCHAEGSLAGEKEP